MRTTLLVMILFLLGNNLAHAEAAAEFTLIIKDHKFTPTQLTVPAGKKIRLIVDNQDASAEEFESYSLNREKVIPGKTKAKIFIGPLKPGTYDFFGEFHMKTALGKIIAQ